MRISYLSNHDIKDLTRLIISDTADKVAADTRSFFPVSAKSWTTRFKSLNKLWALQPNFKASDCNVSEVRL